MSCQVVLLMAGLGTRFARAGYTDSKPLIQVAGRPMFERALAGIEPAGVSRLVVVVRQQQIDEEDIAAKVAALRPEAELVVLPGLTAGAAESALSAVDRLDADRPLVVLDCDLEFSSAAYVAELAHLEDGAFDALLLTFAASDARYSYVRTAPGSREVLEVAEKRVISNRAVAGAYAFRSPAAFAETVQQVLARGLRAGVAEAYMSEVVHGFLERGRAVRAVDVDRYHSFGTPEELVVSEPQVARG
jgi:dTDP-glucose pyrophosphorylase